MAAKEKGLSSDPIMAESGGAKGYTEEEMEEVRSPILQEHRQQQQQRHQSYQNPYDIRFVVPSPEPPRPLAPVFSPTLTLLHLNTIGSTS